MRVNLDGHISRLDLVGNDAVVLRDGKQVTEFQEGIVPWALQRPMALVFDEYDAGRPDVMFVIQRMLERDGKFTLLDQNRVLSPHPYFRLFATANTVGLGNLNGLYHGAQRLNHAQIDRWNIVATLNYLPADEEIAIVQARVPALASDDGRALVARWSQSADLTRKGFAAGDLSTLMSPRTVITWAENLAIFGDVGTAFRLSFVNKCDEAERAVVAEYFQRCFDRELEPHVSAGAAAARAPAGAGRGALRGASIRARSTGETRRCAFAARAPASRRDASCRCSRRICIPRSNATTSPRSAAPPTAWRCASRFPIRAARGARARPMPVERLLFDWLEQFRVESLAPARLPGRRAQPAPSPRAWSLGFPPCRPAPTRRAACCSTRVAQVCARARHRRARRRGDRRPASRPRVSRSRRASATRSPALRRTRDDQAGLRAARAARSRGRRGDARVRRRRRRGEASADAGARRRLRARCSAC